MDNMQNKDEDTRTDAELLRQWERLSKVKNQLIKAGMLNGDATAADVMAALRAALKPR